MSTKEIWRSILWSCIFDMWTTLTGIRRHGLRRTTFKYVRLNIPTITGPCTVPGIWLSRVPDYSRGPHVPFNILTCSWSTGTTERHPVTTRTQKPSTVERTPTVIKWHLWSTVLLCPQWMKGPHVAQVSRSYGLYSVQCTSVDYLTDKICGSRCVKTHRSSKSLGFNVPCGPH